jgi:hypothetical protein
LYVSHGWVGGTMWVRCCAIYTPTISNFLMTWALHFPLTLLLYINIIPRAPCGVCVVRLLVYTMRRVSPFPKKNPFLFLFFYFSTSVLLFCWKIRCDWAERGSPQPNSRLVFLFFTCWRTVVHNKEMERCAVTDVDWRSETCPPLWWPVMKVSNPHRNQKIKETTKPNNRWSKQTYTVYIYLWLI